MCYNKRQIHDINRKAVMQEVRPMTSFKQFVSRHPILSTISYFILYLIWFGWLQKRPIAHEWISSKLDRWIPFCSWFILPYLLWFAFVGCTMLFFLRTSSEDYFRLCTALYTGMTICLIIYTILPNGQLLRPRTMPDDSLLTQLVFFIYHLDPSINSCPSIHALNTMICQDALMRCDALRGHPLVKTLTGVLSVLICIATVCLKQHSILDVFAATVLFIILDCIVYRNVPIFGSQKPKLQTSPLK